jgi:hypothetical protein
LTRSKLSRPVCHLLPVAFYLFIIDFAAPALRCWYQQCSACLSLTGDGRGLRHSEVARRWFNRRHPTSYTFARSSGSSLAVTVGFDTSTGHLQHEKVIIAREEDRDRVNRLGAEEGQVCTWARAGLQEPGEGARSRGQPKPADALVRAAALDGPRDRKAQPHTKTNPVNCFRPRQYFSPNRIARAHTTNALFGCSSAKV